jgi:hypothetical protein
MLTRNTTQIANKMLAAINCTRRFLSGCHERVEKIAGAFCLDSRRDTESAM